MRDRLQTAGSRLRTFGIDYLVYALIDLVVDRKFPLIEALSQPSRGARGRVAGHPTNETLSHIHQARRALVAFHRIEWAERETVLAMMRPETPFIMPETRTYLRDCFDHSVAVLELVESYREMANGLMEVYLMQSSNRMSEVMKTLAIITGLLHAAQLPGRPLRHEFRPRRRQHAGARLAITAMPSSGAWSRSSSSACFSG